MKNRGLIDTERGRKESGRRAMPYVAVFAFGGACQLCKLNND